MSFLLLLLSLGTAEANGVKLLRFDLCEVINLHCPTDTTEITDQLDRCGCLYSSEMVALKDCPSTAAACESGTKWSWLNAKNTQSPIGCGCYDTYYPDED